MTLTLTQRAEAYREAARKVRAIEAAGGPEPQRLEAISAELRDLVRVPGLFPPEAFPREPGTAGGLYRLAQLPGGEGALYVSLGYTGRGMNSPHTHAAWAVVVGISGGTELNKVYERIDDGAVEGQGELRLVQEIDVGPGEAVAIPTGQFHTIQVVSDTPVLHVHAYGRPVEAAGTPLPVFESADSRTYTRGVRGAFTVPLVAAQADEARRDAAEGRAAAVFLDGRREDLAGPFIYAAPPEGAVQALAAVDADVPVILVGSAQAAGDAASALYAAGRPVVFHLRDQAVAQAA